MRLRTLLWLILPILLVLHQDYWQWSDATLWFGFLPQTLFYHAILTLVAAAYWLIMVLFAWPTDLEPTSALPNVTPQKPAPLAAETAAETELEEVTA